MKCTASQIIESNCYSMEAPAAALECELEKHEGVFHQVTSDARTGPQYIVIFTEVGK